MMEKETLRKADIFSGSLIVILGLFIISQAMKMPMKDSWGGVQNVWFVSPALFPLLVGGMLAFLGTVLISIAFKSTGKKGLQEVLAFLVSSELTILLRQPLCVRFYAIVLNLIVFVFLLIPHFDFFLAAIWFLMSSFFMFYFGDHRHLLKIFAFHSCSGLFLLLAITRFSVQLAIINQFATDWLLLFFIFILCLVARSTVKEQTELKKKFRLALIIALVAPLTIGIIFKYFLLVPMPFEGLVVQLLDSIWYSDLWS